RRHWRVAGSNASIAERVAYARTSSNNGFHGKMLVFASAIEMANAPRNAGTMTTHTTKGVRAVRLAGLARTLNQMPASDTPTSSNPVQPAHEKYAPSHVLAG